MQRIVLNYLSGSKARQVDRFSLSQIKEVVLGRDSSATVQFDEMQENMVGRQHAKISPNPADPAHCFITDLNSRNGTFVNGQRLTGLARLRPGDVIQCGVNGPQIRFELEPETDDLSRSLAPAPTVNLAAPADDLIAKPPAAPATASARRWLVAGGVLVALLALAGAGVFFWPRSSAAGDSGNKGKAPAAPSPVVPVNPGVSNPPRPPAAETAEAERDPVRTNWRLEVAPYLVLGSGHPGKAASDFDKPDGAAFAPSGVLYATDAKNRRVQVWDVKTGAHLGEFGHGVFGGEIVDIAVAPSGTVYVTDQTLNLAYVFTPPQPGQLDDKGKPLGPYDYVFKGTRFGEQGFQKLGGIAVDSRDRVYLVDAHRNNVLRFDAEGKPDRTWRFEAQRPDGDTYLHGCEGIALDEHAGNLFIASEKDAVIQVFDWETGAYKHRLVGASADAAGKPGGKSVFFGSVEGLTIARNHLFAVDESAGHIQLFDLGHHELYNLDLAGFGTPQPQRPSGYQGFFGHAPLVNFEDKTDTALQQQVKTGAIIPGQANPPGYFCSPDSITSFTDAASNETYVAIADQCNYRLVVYRWSDIARALGQPVVLKEVPPPPVAPAPVAKPAPRPPVKAAAPRRAAPVRKAVAPRYEESGKKKGKKNKA